MTPDQGLLALLGELRALVAQLQAENVRLMGELQKVESPVEVAE